MDIAPYLQDYLSRYSPYKSYWNYEDGCVLMGCICLYQANGDARYRQFVMDYLDRFVLDDGSIPNYETAQHNIDSINSGKALFFAVQMSDQPKWRTAIEFIMQRLREHPRCKNGSFWHKEIYPWQIWLDGLYMALPFYMDYEMRFGGKAHVSDIMLQFENARRCLFDEEKRLSYHAYDESRQQPWADKRSGCSANSWLRSMGWYLMAMVDCLAIIDEQLFEDKARLQELFREAVRGLLSYRNEDGLFYQVVDKPTLPGNYSETSGSAMAAYAIMKGARIAALHPEKYAPIGRAIFNALVAQKLVQGDKGTQLKDICLVAGLGGKDNRDGSTAYYLSEPIVVDDAKGVGPFMMAYAEALMQDTPIQRRNED